MKWLTQELRQKLRKVFKPRYGRELAESEVEDIAENLVSFTQNVVEMYKKYRYEKCVQNQGLS